jgi:hypothetical protein
VLKMMSKCVSWRRATIAALMIAAGAIDHGGPGARAQSGGCATNPIACENVLAGAPAAEWEVGAGDASIQGFAAEFSVNRGTAIRFKVKTTAAAYRIDIYRMGYYGGAGARKVATVLPSASLPQVQPECLSDPTTGLIDCGNWLESASWNVPPQAVSGIYFAKLTRLDTNGASHVYFVVRADDGHSGVVFQTADATWQAYNTYGGNSLYAGQPAGRAYKVSYNRPFSTRATDPRNAPFYSEYPMVRWLEANGYDVSYISGADADRSAAQLLQHKVFLSVGHDEYWSGGQRANVEAARAAGVSLAFFSGNDVFWKTRWEPSIDGTGTPYRTLVSYKETHANQKIDPDKEAWTGTWRDARFSPPADGGRPENGLTGTLFTVNCCAGRITVPADFAALRFWRHTTIASLPSGEVATLAPESLGYEWNEDVDNGAAPAGLMRLSSTTLTVPQRLVDNGSTYVVGTAHHALTLYRHASGALVFSAGSVQWSWGLDPVHDNPTGTTTDLAMRQASVNLLMDMGVTPATPQADLNTTPAPVDADAPQTVITSPETGTDVAPTGTTVITGTATDAAGVVAGVEVSVDGGLSWHPATGRGTWTYNWSPTAAGPVVVKARAVDDSGNLETPGASAAVSVANPDCPCSIWNPATAVPAVIDVQDDSAVELGVRFRAGLTGYITGIRFYKSAANTGVHAGNLWSTSGALLASAVFVNETATGWQQVHFATAVPVQAGTTYVASYHTNSGHYSASSGYFTTGVDTPPLHAVASSPGALNGLYRYGPSGFPTLSYNASNYWVDVLFSSIQPVDVEPPTVSASFPLPGATNVGRTTQISATFSENVDINTLTMVTFEVRDASGAQVWGAHVYDAVARKTTLIPASPLAYNTTYSVRVRGGTSDPRVKDLAGNALAADVVWSFTTASQSVCPCSLWNPATTVPAIEDSGDSSAVELGMKFRTDISGFIAGLRFYKSAANKGAHTGSLWTSAGTLLARATFANETASGWQQVLFSSPVNVAANTTYVISYHTDFGHYAADTGYFSAGVDAPPLSAPANASNPNGVYRYGVSGFPSSSFNGTNYWVDPIFTTFVGEGDPTPPVVLSVSPAPGTTGVSEAVSPVVRFSKAMSASTISTSTIELRDAADALVPGTVTYDSASFSATFDPADSLASSATYRIVVKGGATAPRVTDIVGNPLPATFTSTFTVATPVVCPCSIWDPQTTVPAVADAGDASMLELGVKFRTDVDGFVTGVRFYKSAANTGPHIGNLWSSSGALLSTATFTNESGSGWQEVTFAAPVAVTANTTYVASYHTTAGHYAATGGFFASAGAGNPPVRALSNAAGANGVYWYGASAFPAFSYNATNYWVDVVFNTSIDTEDPELPSGFLDTTVADFSLGTADAGGYVARTGDGEVMLAPAAGSEFDGTALPATWSTVSWGGGWSATVSGGVLNIDGARASTTALFGPGRSLEFSATFSGAAYQHVGFGVTFNETPWAIFSSGPGDGLYARTNNGSTPLDTRIAGSWFGAPHRFRIDWTPAEVSYWIDGVRVVTHALAVSGSLRPIASDYGGDGDGLRVDWLRLTPYAASATYLSAVHDAGASVAWAQAMWNGSAPAGTAVTLAVRYGDTPAPDGSWTAFTPVTGGALSGTGRYIQYRLGLSTTNASLSPVISDITVTFNR